MLKQILSDIKAFFSMNSLSITNNPEEYVRLIRIINRSYCAVSTEYPLPELDRAILLKASRSKEFFSDFIPYRTTDTRTLANVPYQLLADYTIADIYGLESTVPTSVVLLDNIVCDTIMRKSFAAESSAVVSEEITEDIAPFSSYQLDFDALSTWGITLYANDIKIFSAQEVITPTLLTTSSTYGTFTIDYLQMRITVRSGRVPYRFRAETTSFASWQFRCVLDHMGIRFLYRKAPEAPYSKQITIIQRTKPPLLLAETDNSINNQYDIAISLMSIENMATFNRSMMNTQLYGVINQKRAVEFERLGKLVSNYRTRRSYSTFVIPTIR